MNKQEKMIFIITILILGILFTPIGIAIYKMWQYGIKSALQWDGRP